MCWSQRGVFCIGSPVHGRVGLTLRQHRLNQPNGMIGTGAEIQPVNTSQTVGGEEDGGFRRGGGLFRGGDCDNFQTGQEPVIRGERI